MQLLGQVALGSDILRLATLLQSEPPQLNLKVELAMFAAVHAVLLYLAGLLLDDLLVKFLWEICTQY